MWGGGWNSTCGSSGCIHTRITFLCWAAWGKKKSFLKSLYGGLGVGELGWGKDAIRYVGSSGCIHAWITFLCWAAPHTKKRKKRKEKKEKKRRPQCLSE